MTKKKTTIGFMLVDHVEGDDDDATTYSIDQRVELDSKEFNAWAKKGLCEKGIRVEMLVGVEGGRFSLKAHDRTWLPGRIAKAWQAEGMCVPASGEASFDEAVKVYQDGATTALAERDAALKQVAAMTKQLQELTVLHAALEDQVRTVVPLLAVMVSENAPEKLLDQGLAEVEKLAAMLPDLDDDDPELDLDRKSDGGK